MQTKWSVTGNQYTPVETENLSEVFSRGVYRVNYSQIEGFTLSRLEDEFVFKHKIYALERKFINHVLKTYEHTTGNIGALLNGIKGGGKSVTCKVLANELQLPVILIEQNFGVGLVQFISRIQQDVIIFVDEYEKVYSNGNSLDEDDSTEQDSTLLTLMDGALNSTFRRFFLLTTNKLSVNANLLQRPGRVRYLKNFGNLKRDVIEEIVDDKLVHKHLRDSTIKFLAQLETITIDIVSSLVTEVNIHEEELDSFADILNVVKNEVKYTLIQLLDRGKEREKVLHYNTDLTSTLEEYKVGDTIGNESRDFGEIMESKGDNTYVIKLDYYHNLRTTAKEGSLITVRVEPNIVYHDSYKNAF